MTNSAMTAIMKATWCVLSLAMLIAGCSHVKMGLFLLKSNTTEHDPDSVARGKTTYEARCASYHGEHADGGGPAGKELTVHPTDFTAPAYEKSAARMAAHIAYGKGDAMPAFSEALPEETIWDLANYLHSLQKAEHAERAPRLRT